MEKQHPFKNWELSISEYETNTGKLQWKVTRRLPTMSVTETKMFNSKEEAVRQYEDWLK